MARRDRPREERIESVSSVRWEIRGPWPSIEEIERRFDELIRSRWGARGKVVADVLVRGDEMWVEIEIPGIDDWTVAEAGPRDGLLRIHLHKEKR